jgi:hypothetical protein
MKIRNSKSETNSETNKSQIGKIQNSESEGSLFGILFFWSFEFVSDFGFFVFITGGMIRA